MEDLSLEEDLLLRMVRLMVKFPDQVEVKRTLDEHGVLLTLKVSLSDIGHVIGSQGETARALRKILASVGFNIKSRISMEIWESSEDHQAHQKMIRRKKMSVEDTFSDSALSI